MHAAGRIAAGRRATAARRWLVPIGAALGASACSYMPYIPAIMSPPPSAGVTIVDSGGRVIGSGVFVQHREGVRVLVDVKGLTPGVKAVHIHEVGRCDAPTFETAGAHFNPDNTAHGVENPRGPHAGDLPSITVDGTGQGHLETTEKRITVTKGKRSLFDGDGSALVLHERADDRRTDPDGDSGARIACGVIVRGG